MKKNIVVIGLGIAALVIGAQSAAALAAIAPNAVATALPSPSFAWQGHSEGHHGRHLGQFRGSQDVRSGDVRGSHDFRSGDVRHIEFHSGDVRPSFDVRGTFDVRDDADESGDVREHGGHPGKGGQGMWGGPFGSIDVRPSRPSADIRFHQSVDVRFRPAPIAVSGDTRQAPPSGGRHGGHH
ncbi:MAG: hypothetical protein KGL72_05220 [Actinomycetales bacterium]|nr:hypothetical protein [Actinomycetales bacterium]